MDNKILENISKKLSLLISLMIEKNEKLSSNREKVDYLKRFKVDNKDMAEILGINENNLRVTLTHLKNKKKK